MIREILKMGDPRLRRVAKPVENINDPDLKAIIADMYETMRAANGVGIAAPQIGVDLRLMIFGFDENPRYPDEPPVPLTTLINPWIEVLTAETEDGWCPGRPPSAMAASLRTAKPSSARRGIFTLASSSTSSTT